RICDTIDDHETHDDPPGRLLGHDPADELLADNPADELLADHSPGPVLANNAAFCSHTAEQRTSVLHHAPLSQWPNYRPCWGVLRPAGRSQAKSECHSATPAKNRRRSDLHNAPGRGQGGEH